MTSTENPDEGNDHINDSAADWRDLASKLTAEQLADLNKLESEVINECRDLEPDEADRFRQQMLGFNARFYAFRNEAAKRYAHVPLPPGVTEPCPWDRRPDGTPYRCVEWGVFGDDDGITVYVLGDQETDGSYEKHIEVFGVDDGDVLDAETARDLSRFLAAAADVVEQDDDA